MDSEPREDTAGRRTAVRRQSAKLHQYPMRLPHIIRDGQPNTSRQNPLAYGRAVKPNGNNVMQNNQIARNLEAHQRFYAKLLAPPPKYDAKYQQIKALYGDMERLLTRLRRLENSLGYDGYKFSLDLGIGAGSSGRGGSGSLDPTGAGDTSGSTSDTGGTGSNGGGGHYNSDEPRVPAGSPEGGQWTDGGNGNSDVVGVTVDEFGNVIIEYADGSIETRIGGSIAWRNNNPGNIRAGSFARSHGSIGTGARGFALFRNESAG